MEGSKSIGGDARRLVKRAKKEGVSRETFSGCYRATLYARPWRLIVVPMPAQPAGTGATHTDPNGVLWELGARITAVLIARQIGERPFDPTNKYLSPTAPLAFAYEF